MGESIVHMNHIFGVSVFSFLFKINFILQTFISFLFIVAYAQTNSKEYFSFPRDGTAIIDYSGDAVVSTKTGIQLTESGFMGKYSGSTGRASYNKPVHLWDKHADKTAKFTTHFSFKITQMKNNTNFYGDGLAFFLTSFNEDTADAPDNSSGKCLGLVGGATQDLCNVTSYPIVAVEFDTYSNSDWDSLPTDHVGINVNSTKSVVSLPVGNGGLKFRNASQSANAWITYDSSTKNLSVFLTYDENYVFNLSHVIDLRAILPEYVRVGFASSTGSSYELHTILSWDFNSTLDGYIDIAPSSQPPIIDPVPSSEDPVPRKSRAALVGGLVAGASVLTIGLGLLMWWQRRSRGSNSNNDDLNLVDDDDFDQETGPKRFTYNDLTHVTNNFSEEGKLGEGGFGGVYRGFSTNLNREIAVKKISRESKQGKKEYVSEVKVISRLRHKNLVQLLGWCHEGGSLLLVYEYMPNRSLDSHIYTGKRKGVLPWEKRYKIALDLASALLYLHQEWEQCVLHRDIKSSNVMLDSDFNAKLGDFGLARLVDHNLGSQTTILAGTLGYLAPECVLTGKSTKESDVYSFGVVALEIACGRRPVESTEEASKVNMVEWVWNLYGEGRLLEAVDEKLEEEFDVQQIECLMVVGLWCCHPEYTYRPSIRQVINVLNLESPMPSLPLRFPVPIYYSSQIHASPLYISSSSGLTGNSGTTGSSSQSAVSGTAPLLSDNAIV